MYAKQNSEIYPPKIELQIMVYQSTAFVICFQLFVCCPMQSSLLDVPTC